MTGALPPPWPLAAALLLFLWPFALYPALMSVYLKTRRREPPPGLPDDALPEAALIICALNEERIIGEKLRNSLELDYPAGKLHIVVVSDGSTDGTAAAVRAFAGAGVELIEQPQRRGKVTNLNEVIPSRREPVVALSDANVIYDRAALRRLMARLADAAVGCVSGKVVLVKTHAGLRGGEAQYYSLEWLLQEASSHLHSMAGADGAMYALRRELFRPCPPDTLIEDLVIPVQIVRQGYRCVMEPAALGWEEGPQSAAEEFRRKVRIAAGAAQALLRGNGWPGGRAPAAFWFVFLSHKLLRWLSPLTLAAALAAALATLPHPASAALLGGALLLALLAGGRAWTGRPGALWDTPYYFCFGQIALLKGLWRGARGRQTVLWAKENR